MLEAATTATGPKRTGIPGRDVDQTDDPDGAIKAPRSAKPDVIVEKNLAKKPAVKPADAVVECESVEDALELANKRNRAVMSASGWVCPSIIRERR